MTAIVLPHVDPAFQLIEVEVEADRQATCTINVFAPTAKQTEQAIYEWFMFGQDDCLQHEKQHIAELYGADLAQFQQAGSNIYVELFWF